MQTARDPLPPPRGFESLAVLAHGARATVHRAARGFEVATLIVSPGGDADADARFRAEAQRVGAACDGPGMVPVTEVLVDAERRVRALVLPAIDHTLADEACARPLLDALALLEPVARALGRLHRLGTGHGALEPSRIIVSGGEARLFDLVAAALGCLSANGATRPEWSAPEQLDARASDLARTDVHALALLFSFVVSGRAPYSEASAASLYARVTDRERRPTLGSAGVPVGAGVDRVLERALSVDPELRFVHADAFWDALRTAVFAAPLAIAEAPLPKPAEPAHQAHARPVRAPLPIVLGTSLALVALGFGGEAAVHHLRRWRASTATRAPIAAPSPASSTWAPSGSASASSSNVAAATRPAPSPSPSAPPPELPPMVAVPADAPTLWVDRTEVTVRAYKACVTEKACSETWKHGSSYDPDDPVRREWLCNYWRKDRIDHPINCITFNEANAYCAWAGKRLPTGPEWTRAARGDDARRYPWGDAKPRCKDAVFARYGPDNPGCNRQAIGTAKADAHPQTASPFGALDMAGSLWEWTTERSARGLPWLRGGAWDSPETGIGVDARLEQSPGNGDVTLGFRCVKDAD